MTRRRPPGLSSRVRPARGERRTWVAPNGTEVDLPVIVDLVDTDAATGSKTWWVEATVDLVDGSPALLAVHMRSTYPMDPEILQRKFRWATPLEIATITVPELLASGLDPYEYNYPRTGFPQAASVERSAPTRLTDEFLTEIATRYVMIGRGYAKTIADQRHVSPRTVVSWIEKARERGILSATTNGSVGGTVRTGRRARTTKRS